MTRDEATELRGCAETLDELVPKLEVIMRLLLKQGQGDLYDQLDSIVEGIEEVAIRIRPIEQ